MPKQIDLTALALFCAIAAVWISFGALLVRWKKPPKTAERVRDPRSFGGLALQTVAYAMVWFGARTNFSPVVPMPKWAEITVAAADLVLAALSIVLMWRAILALGKQWAYAARIVQGHELVTAGPYSLVRNPIYTGMLGILLATGIAVARWPLFIAAIVLYLIGTWIRIRREERLLRQAFGPEFEAYRRRVPALIPWVI